MKAEVKKIKMLRDLYLNYVGRSDSGDVEIVVNMTPHKILFKYNHKEHLMSIYINPSGAKVEMLYDQITDIIFITGHEALDFAKDYYESEYEGLKAELNVMESITLEVYEVTNGVVTGYKIYKDKDQVATLEFRSNEWIAAVIEGFAIVTLRTKFQHDAIGWIKSMIKKEHKKRE